MTKVSAATDEQVILLKAYKGFENVFSNKNDGRFLPNIDHDYAINLVIGNQPLYTFFYSLSKNELSIL